MKINLDEEEKKIWDKLIDGLRSSNRDQKWLKILFVLGGAALSAISSGFEGPILPTNSDGLTVKGAILFLGVFLGFIGGALLICIEWDTSDTLHDAKNYIGEAKKYLNERNILQERDDKRRALLDAQSDMLEAIERFPEDIKLTVALDTILKTSSQYLPRAIGFDINETWAFSIFQKIERDGLECMHRIAVHWLDRKAEGHIPRDWLIGEGFTGKAWETGDEVIVSDAYDPEHNEQYLPPHNKQLPEDSKKYVSVASIPIKVANENSIWGVVTATSNKVGRFKRNPQDHNSQDVDTVRALARIAAVQVVISNRNE